MTQEYDKWIRIGVGNNQNYMIVVQDLEDKQLFPVYFQFYSDQVRYQENIISESKLKILHFFKLDNYNFQESK